MAVSHAPMVVLHLRQTHENYGGHTLKNVTLFLLSIAVATTLLTFGYGDRSPDAILNARVVDESLGEIKQPIHTEIPAAPQMPSTSEPRVIEVGYYKDARLTQPLSISVGGQRNIYTKVVFSEPMQHTRPYNDLLVICSWFMIKSEEIS